MGCVSHSMTKQINGPHTVHVATYKSCALTASGFATISGFSAENVRDFHMASRQLLAPSVTSGGRSASAVAAGGAFGAPAEAIVVSRLLSLPYCTAALSERARCSLGGVICGTATGVGTPQQNGVGGARPSCVCARAWHWLGWRNQVLHIITNHHIAKWRHDSPNAPIFGSKSMCTFVCRKM